MLCKSINIMAFSIALLYSHRMSNFKKTYSMVNFCGDRVAMGDEVCRNGMGIKHETCANSSADSTNKNHLNTITTQAVTFQQR